MKVAIAGAGGRLGAALARLYSLHYEVRAFTRPELDLAAPEQLRESLGNTAFDVLINCAAQTNVDRCETEQEEAFAINAIAPGVLADSCNARGARLIHISTDYVFDGGASQPYTEEDEAKPISVYGASKLAGEERVRAAGEQHVVARVSWVFGPDRPSFLDAIIKRAREEEQVEAIADKISTPTYTVDTADLLRPFLDSTTPGGVYHLTNEGACTWQEYGQWGLDCCRREGIPLRAEVVGPLALADMKNFIARRPVYTALSIAKYQQVTGRRPRSWRAAVAAYVRDHLAPRAEV